MRTHIVVGSLWPERYEAQATSDELLLFIVQKETKDDICLKLLLRKYPTEQEYSTAISSLLSKDFSIHITKDNQKKLIYSCDLPLGFNELGKAKAKLAMQECPSDLFIDSVEYNTYFKSMIDINKVEECVKIADLVSELRKNLIFESWSVIEREKKLQLTTTDERVFKIDLPLVKIGEIKEPKSYLYYMDLEIPYEDLPILVGRRLWSIRTKVQFIAFVKAIVSYFKFGYIHSNENTLYYLPISSKEAIVESVRRIANFTSLSPHTF